MECGDLISLVGGPKRGQVTALQRALLYLAVDDVPTRIEELRADGVVVESEPHVIFSHEDNTLGPAGTDEWQAFVKDTEGNTVGLVEQRPTTVVEP